jgi:transcriptional regulator PpsR
VSKRETGPADLSALSNLAPELAEMLVSVAGDIALVLDEGGVIQSVALGGVEPMSAAAGDWVGRPWSETVTSDTRKKVEELLRDVAATGVSRLRHVSHQSAFGLDIPIAYTAVRLGERGPLLVVGRDMRAIAAIQERLVQTQQEMERDYWQRRQSETRYRFLFKIATEPALVVDATTLCIVDANRAAARLFGLSPEALTGKSAVTGIELNSRAQVEELLATVRVTSRVAQGEADLSDLRGKVHVWVTPFSAEGASLLLMRLRTVDASDERPDINSKLANLAEQTSDAIVITDADGHITLANPAFVTLSQAVDPNQIKGRMLSDWIGRTPNDLTMIIEKVRKDASSGLFATSARGEKGQIVEIEVSAVLIPDGNGECFGFIMRVAHGRSAAGRADSLPVAGQIH